MEGFYRRTRLEPPAFDDFWLSDTPRVVASSTGDNRNRRMVTWVLFGDQQTRNRFLFWIPHLDHEVPLVREKLARRI
ncbi:MAG: hypothetical protein RMN51_04570 [Verrucomicrobiota bacterium]|nr:hypothetical protein [Limisphaera sp.]MDW8381367.1 hypothetical protein [Verrucomicrobiota bacterium]